MNKNEILKKMLEICAGHIDSLEVYDEFPGVPSDEIDKVKEDIQFMLRQLAGKVKTTSKKNK